MAFKDKYCSTADKDKLENKDKTVISTDTFAIGELLDSIRVELFRGNRHG